MKTVFIPIAVFKPSGHDVTNETRMKRIKIRNLHLVNSAFSRQVGSFANSEKKESAALTNEESKRGESGEMGRLISGSAQFHTKIWMYLMYVGTPCTIRRFSYSSEICSVNDHDVLLLFFFGVQISDSSTCTAQLPEYVWYPYHHPPARRRCDRCARG